MIRITVHTGDKTEEQMTAFLNYTTEKMSGERSDAHDTATPAYVIGRKVRDAGLRAGEKAYEVWVSNEFARPACREFRMFLSYQSTRGMGESAARLRYSLVADLCDQLDAAIKKQDGEKWAEERAKQAKRRPTVRDARSA